MTTSKKPQARQPSGAPASTGGQFATEPRAESEVSLSEPTSAGFDKGRLALAKKASELLDLRQELIDSDDTPDGLYDLWAVSCTEFAQSVDAWEHETKQRFYRLDTMADTYFHGPTIGGAPVEAMNRHQIERLGHDVDEMRETYINAYIAADDGDSDFDPGATDPRCLESREAWEAAAGQMVTLMNIHSGRSWPGNRTIIQPVRWEDLDARSREAVEEPVNFV